MKNWRKSLSILLLVALIAGLFAGCGSAEEKTFESLEDFKRAKVGVLTGSAFDLLAREYLPEAEKHYYINMTDLLPTLKQGKIDGIMMDKGFFAPLKWEDSQLTYIPTDLPASEFAVAFPKTEESEPLMEQVNEFIRTQTENGELARLTDKWLSSAEPDGSLDLTQLTGENGTLRIATTVESKPFDYLRNGQFCGFDADFIYAFAKEYGYALDIDIIDFGALLPSLAAQRYDLAISSITVTAERKESMYFSDTYCSNPVVMVVMDENTSQQPTLADLKNATLGIVTGTNADFVAQKLFPNAERKYFNSTADVLLALEQSKVDSFFADKTVFAGMRWENPTIDFIDEPLETYDNALILAKEGYDENLLNQLNEFIANSKKNGLLEELDKKWFGVSEPSEHPDYTKLTGTNGTLKIAISDSMKPTSYQRELVYTGYEIDFLTRFAEEYGYQLEVHGMSFEALIPTVSSGKCDIGASGITITEERKDSVTFTDSHFQTYGVAVVRSRAGESTPQKTLADFEDATIGVMTGSVFDTFAKEQFPKAKREYYSMLSDMIVAVEQGKLDGFISENTYAAAAIWEGANIKEIEDPIAQTEAGFIFRKDEKSSLLREQMNQFLSEARESGLLDELAQKWIGNTEPAEKLDYDSLTGENGTLKIAVAPDLKPLSYIKNRKPTGYEMELLLRFAREYGYQLDMSYMTFDAILPSVTSGKYDIGSGAIAITEERAQSVDFSDSHLKVDIVMVVKGDEKAASGSEFWIGVKESFNKTFVREDRWRLIADGVGVTVLISLCAAFAGTLLGFGLYMLGRSDAKVLQILTRWIAKGYSRIIAGTPVVVILMILFYVIFGKFKDMSGIIVAIIGFTLTFGAFVYDHMTVSVGSVDHGQTEAAYALGYTKNQTFFRIIFPQAMSIFLPSYCGQMVELIKATAVVGYIAVNDLTKMGDIIRSNTYEAFFPLLATAVIYFILTWLLSLLLKLVKMRFEPKRRSKEDILKGVKTL